MAFVFMPTLKWTSTAVATMLEEIEKSERTKTTPTNTQCDQISRYSWKYPTLFYCSALFSTADNGHFHY